MCIALLGILVLGFGFLNGLAIACALTVVFTVLAAVTLLPALLGVFGMRVLSRRQRRTPGHAAGARRRAGVDGGRRVGAVGGHRAAAPGGARRRGRGRSCWCSPSPCCSLRLGTSDQGNDPASSTTRQAYDLLAEGFGPGFNGPLVLVAQTSSPADAAALRALEARPAARGGRRQRRTDAGRDRRHRGHPGDPAHLAGGAGDLRSDHHLAQQHDPGGRARHDAAGIRRRHQRHVRGLRLGGRAPSCRGSSLTIIGLSFLLLVVAFRSLLIPATAAVMNLLAAAASFGVLTAFFQWGWGTNAFGLGTAGPVEAFLPVVMLAILFGLSMDYQVFLVSRMNEEWVRGRGTAAAPSAPGRWRHGAGHHRGGDDHDLRVPGVLAHGPAGHRRVRHRPGGRGRAGRVHPAHRAACRPSMHMFGDANWWLPRWLDRRLPHLAIEPPQAAPRRTRSSPRGPLIRGRRRSPAAAPAPVFLSRTDPVPALAEVLLRADKKPRTSGKKLG